MIEFRAPEIQDRHWVEEILLRDGNERCEYSFVNLLAWGKCCGLMIAPVDGQMASYLPQGKGPGYPYPLGPGDARPVLEALRADAAQRGIPFRLLSLSRGDAEELEGAYPGRFRITEDRAGFDYVYDIDRLADLAGKKLHAKRNHIHRFVEAHPDWSVEELAADNLSDCLAMFEAWGRLARENAAGEGLDDEENALRHALAHREALELKGLLLRSEGQVLAFTLGSRMSGDTFDVHFEKAFGQVQGAYAIINREFARWVRERYPQVRWLNREEDMGLEGLRKAKSSYYPDRMVEKFVAEWME